MLSLSLSSARCQPIWAMSFLYVPSLLPTNLSSRIETGGFGVIKPQKVVASVRRSRCKRPKDKMVMVMVMTVHTPHETWRFIHRTTWKEVENLGHTNKNM